MPDPLGGGTLNSPTVTAPLDALVIGAGFGGLHMLYRLRELGLRTMAVEAGGDVGGAWYWNRYPGARCDVESLAYSYSFSPALDDEWRWSERYSAQPEILSYIRFAADRLDLRRDIRFETRVMRAAFDEQANLWRIETDRGDRWAARYLVMATGPISEPMLPDIPGIEGFQGQLIHTAKWPQDQSPQLAGKRIGVVGTGSSGTQLIPKVAEVAERLFVFLRTPNFTVPAKNRPASDEEHAQWVERRVEIRAAMDRGEVGGAGDTLMPEQYRRTRITPAAAFSPERQQEILEYRWNTGGAVLMHAFADVMTDEAVNEKVAEFIRGKIRETVKDPVKAELLTPRGYPLGTKRICVATDYYETYNRDNVEIVDVKRDPIERVTPRGVVTGGREITLDALVFATGFDALTGAITAIDLRGRGGVSIQDAWRDGPHTWLGFGMAGFPNLMMIGGPGSPSVLTNVVRTNEFQVNFIADLLAAQQRQGLTCFEVKREAQEAWTAQVNEVVKRTVLAKAKSWYVGDNVPGKAHAILVYTGGTAAYRSACNRVREEGFSGLQRS